MDQLPFDLSDCQDELGIIKLATLQCPGIYYIRTDYTQKHPLGLEFYIVTDEAPISAEARTYGKRLSAHPELLLYLIDDDNGNWMILEYEINKYRVKNQLPLPEGETLRSIAIFAMESHPEYFGMFPPPTLTSRGYTVRYKVMGNGIYWIETDQCEEVLAVAYPVWIVELSEVAERLSEQTKFDKTLGYLFFSVQSCPVPIYELLRTRPEWISSGMINKSALMNAIWSNRPEYALVYNKLEQAGLSTPLDAVLNELGADIELTPPEDHMITLFPDVGTEFLNLY